MARVTYSLTSYPKIIITPKDNASSRHIWTWPLSFSVVFSVRRGVRGLRYEKVRPGCSSFRLGEQIIEDSHLGCWWQNATNFSCQSILFTLEEIIMKETFLFPFLGLICVSRIRSISASSFPEQRLVIELIPFLVVSFRGQIKLEPRPDWSPLGV